MSNFENKIIKKKKIDKELNLKVTQNNASERIFVEFSSENGKLVLQKSFQKNHKGTEEALEFQDSIKSIADLKKYFGLK